MLTFRPVVFAGRYVAWIWLPARGLGGGRSNRNVRLHLHVGLLFDQDQCRYTKAFESGTMLLALSCIPSLIVRANNIHEHELSTTESTKHWHFWNKDWEGGV